MSYGLSTHAQRLAWQHAETRHGYDDDPSLAEQFEDADTAFRHFDSYVFAPQATAVAPGRDPGANGAAAITDDGGGSSEVSPSPVPEGPLITGVAGGGDTNDSAPSAFVCPATPSVERWMWAA